MSPKPSEQPTRNREEPRSAPAQPPVRVLRALEPGVVSTYPLPARAELEVGRSEEAAIRLFDASISRHHLRLCVTPERLTLIELDSANGTTLGGQKLVAGEEVELGVGEVLEAGCGVMLVVQLESGVEQAFRVFSPALFNQELLALRAQLDGAGGRYALLQLQLSPAFDTPLIEKVLASTLGPRDLMGRQGPGSYELLLVHSGRVDGMGILGALTRRLADLGINVQSELTCFPDDKAKLARPGRPAPPGTAAAAAAPARATALAHDPELARLVERVAGSTMTVLLQGETGVGKEVLAETIHQLSPRRHQSFLRLNCAALSEALFESELFGHERGAFTGADKSRVGLLEHCAGGTVLLDEVGELPRGAQSKLLRVLEERRVLPVGGREPRPIDVRVIAASNRQLEAEVERGEFRADLYFRLAQFTITIPPLRERTGQIAELCATFIDQACRLADRAPLSLSSQALELLQAHGWPGNVRELRNVVERACLLCEGDEIGPEHLPAKLSLRAQASGPGAPAASGASGAMGAAGLRAELDAVERDRILDALARCHGNQTRAAELLGMTRTTFIERLEKYGVPRPRKSPR
jgi:DNA-binding NtrC family response regulator